VSFENSSLFNAGKGAVFTRDGKNELDAAIMDGKTGQAGAVGCVTTIKNPIKAARAVMEKSQHVLFVGNGADKFAQSQGIEIVDPSYFFTQHRWDQLQEAKKHDAIMLDHSDLKSNDFTNGQFNHSSDGSRYQSWMVDHKFGTVGAVALDINGNLAAATSTGGLTNKSPGRVGDTPVIGSGTFADNNTVAVSCTGVGEFFMRGVVAYDISARIKYGKQNLANAVDDTLHEKLDQKGGLGGIIAVDKMGSVKFAFNTEGMYRGYIRDDGKAIVKIYANE